MAWITDRDCPPDRIYMMSPSQYKAYQRLGYSQEGVLWEPGIHALEVAGKSGWVLTGYKVNGEDTTWFPSVWGQPKRPFSANDDQEKDGWILILENALSGCPVAFQAFKDIVESNPEYHEFRETLDVLSEDYA